MIKDFFAEKSQQLVFYASRYLRGQLSQHELHLFIWDTLEEWSHFHINNHCPATRKEQVFWHVMYQLEFWSEAELKHNRILRRKLQSCLGYLQGKTRLPYPCIGIRP